MSLNTAISNESNNNNLLSPKIKSKPIAQYQGSQSLNAAINGVFSTPTLSHSSSLTNIIDDAIKNIQIPSQLNFQNIQIPSIGSTPIGSPPLSVNNFVPAQPINGPTDIELISADLNALSVTNDIQNQQQKQAPPPHPIMFDNNMSMKMNMNQQYYQFYQQQQMQQQYQQMQYMQQMQQIQQFQQFQPIKRMSNNNHNDNNIKGARRKKYVRNMNFNNFDDTNSKKKLSYNSYYNDIVECINNNLIVDMIITQEGSRFIQKEYKELNEKNKSLLLKQVLNSNIIELSKNVFGNWVIQLIYEYATFEQRKEIINLLKGKVLELSLDGFGCRLIQKIVSTREEDDELKQLILSELHGNTIVCLRNNNGHHVIEKILSNCSTLLSTFILKEIIPQLMALAVDPFGCQIIELILQKFSFEKKEIKELMIRITSNIGKMSKHKFGNYIIQDVIESAPLETQDKMFKAIFSDIVDLSKNKYSSNVVEKSIYLCSSKRRRKLVRSIITQIEILKSDENQSIITSMLYQLIYDKFGNYVIQTLLLCSGRKDREKLIEAINDICPNLIETPYGKHIKSAITKVIKQNAQ